MKKTILITGASAGFGAACARKYRGQDLDVAFRNQRYAEPRSMKPVPGHLRKFMRYVYDKMFRHDDPEKPLFLDWVQSRGFEVEELDR